MAEQFSNKSIPKNCHKPWSGLMFILSLGNLLANLSILLKSIHHKILHFQNKILALIKSVVIIQPLWPHFWPDRVFCFENGTIVQWIYFDGWLVFHRPVCKQRKNTNDYTELKKYVYIIHLNQVKFLCNKGSFMNLRSL